ncbi:FtsB family cell division protein [Ureibacillus sp. FSL K6-2830]|uniref:FtsB family cell division protein n=1 Tax=Ureibacillus sp. FSL K6-2830 TaxID=2954610 RepID=UPI0030F7ECFA
MAKHYNNRHGNMNIRKIDNDYVRSANRQMEKLTKQKVRLRRRLSLFFVIASVVIISLISMIFNQNERLAQKEAEKEKVLSELQEIKKEQELLQLQIKKLEDDEYIAKLARKEYFLSEEGEIIFSIPKEEKENEEDKKNKK